MLLYIFTAEPSFCIYILPITVTDVDNLEVFKAALNDTFTGKKTVPFKEQTALTFLSSSL